MFENTIVLLFSDFAVSAIIFENTSALKLTTESWLKEIIFSAPFLANKDNCSSLTFPIEIAVQFPPVILATSFA